MMTPPAAPGLNANSGNSANIWNTNPSSPNWGQSLLSYINSGDTSQINALFGPNAGQASTTTNYLGETTGGGQVGPSGAQNLASLIGSVANQNAQPKSYAAPSGPFTAGDSLQQYLSNYISGVSNNMASGVNNSTSPNNGPPGTNPVVGNGGSQAYPAMPNLSGPTMNDVGAAAGLSPADITEFNKTGLSPAQVGQKFGLQFPSYSNATLYPTGPTALQTPAQLTAATAALQQLPPPAPSAPASGSTAMVASPGIKK